MTNIVERFLNWTHKAPPAQRAGAAAALARSYLQSAMNEQERDQVDAAMTVLLDDPAVEVRAALAVVLGESELAPHHLILSLADDTTSVAVSVLARSPLILDTELVDRLATDEEAIQCAIARRPFVSRGVAAALAEVGSSAACLTLLENGGARLPRSALNRMIERHGDDAQLRVILLERKDLPLDVRQVLVNRLAASLRELIVGRDWMSPERAEAVTRGARERATIAAAFEAPAASVPVLVGGMLAAGDLTPAFLIRAAASGQTLVFESALSLLTSMPQERVHALIASGREAGLKALLAKAGLPPRTLPAFAAVFDVLRQGDQGVGPLSDYRRATRLIESIVARYGKRRDQETDQILALLRGFVVEAKRAAARSVAGQTRQAA